MSSRFPLRHKFHFLQISRDQLTFAMQARMGKKSSLSLRASSTPFRVRLRFYAQICPNCSSSTFGCMTSTKGLAQKRISTVAEQASVVGDRLCCMEIGGLPAPKVSVSIVPSHVHHRGPLSISLQWRRRDLTIESPATWSLWKSIFPYPFEIRWEFRKKLLFLHGNFAALQVAPGGRNRVFLRPSGRVL